MGKQPYRIAIIVLALLGIAFMGYLSYLHYTPEKQAFCDLGEELSCSVVNKSRYAKVAGVPFSVAGALYFIGVLYLALVKYNDKTLKLILASSILFLGPSFYLTGVELFILNSLCIFCEGSKVLILGLAGASWKELGTEKFPPKNIVGLLVSALILAAIVFAIHSNQGPGDKYEEFTQCLTEKGFVMYGSATCQYCAKQRAMIGEEVFEKNINEIECDPRNEGNVAELCIEKNIEQTPTWMQEDEEGNELYRFDAGVQKLEKLSEVSGCPLPAE